MATSGASYAMWRRWGIVLLAVAFVLYCMTTFSYESSEFTSALSDAQTTTVHPRTTTSLREPTLPENTSVPLVGAVEEENGESLLKSDAAAPAESPAQQAAAKEAPTPIEETPGTSELPAVSAMGSLVAEGSSELAVVEATASEGSDRKGHGIFKGALVRGFVQKSGMVPPAYFTAGTNSARRTGFDQWMHSYANGNLVGHAPTPFPYCQVYINHEYKFIWIKGHKVGSTSMRGPLGWLCKDGWRVPQGADFSHCSAPVFKNETLAIKDLKNWWKEYFVFGIVRNPYARFASAEEYIGNMVPEKCGRPTFENTCHEPFIHARVCKVRQCCFSGAVSHHYRHFMEQSSCMFTDSLLPAVDFIGEVENLVDDFETIIQTINQRRRADLPALVSTLTKKNSHGRRLEEASYAERLFKKHPVCLQSIAKFFHRDFALFEYEELEESDTQ